jgi:hypothetical protein
MKLNPNKVGIVVRCAKCGHTKQPRGRSAPMYSSFCDGYTCDGYGQDPQVGDLWPGESEEDFGYPVRDDGTQIVEQQEEGRGE